MEDELEQLKTKQAAKMKELAELREYEPGFNVVWGQLGEISNSINDILRRQHGEQIKGLEEQFWINHHRKPRRNHCFKCKKELFEVEREVCRNCNWMICDVDGACGCQFIEDA